MNSSPFALGLSLTTRYIHTTIAPIAAPDKGTGGVRGVRQELLSGARPSRLFFWRVARYTGDQRGRRSRRSVSVDHGRRPPFGGARSDSAPRPTGRSAHGGRGHAVRVPP